MKNLSLSILLLIFTFLSLSSIVNATDVHQRCIQGDKEACFNVRDIQRVYELKKMLVLWEHLKKLEKFPDCDPRFCDPVRFDSVVEIDNSFEPNPQPNLLDALRINPDEYREILIDLDNDINKEIESLEKFN
ncbi:MAG: hypothetical protein V3V31_16300 [Methylococcales bacterium]